MPALIAKSKSIEEHADAIAKILPKVRILIQLPEGLRWKSNDIVSALEKKGVEVVVSGGRCFGACDLPLKEAAACKAEAILHVGHRPFYVKAESPVPVFYYDWPMDFDIDDKTVMKEAKKLKEDKIGIVTSVQYIEAAKQITKIMSKSGKNAEFGGYVLGCWSEAAENLRKKGYETIMFVGSGLFHPLGFDCKYVLDVEEGKIRDISQEQLKWQKTKYARISKAREAKNFGILISSKSGQKELLARAEKIKARLEQRNKKAFIIVMDEIRAETLSEMRVDAFINTACPRIADDEWKKPLVNADEMDLLLEE
ncbi:MAG: diphthamide biosynthesis enzyme Dph2 [Candidatus Aenigmarchaeota archaeon]|nr:diphthamide biosynthesis enzyme Dph2 [Candidatus Aenigmarchaeota archaeon]